MTLFLSFLMMIAMFNVYLGMETGSPMQTLLGMFFTALILVAQLWILP